MHKKIFPVIALIFLLLSGCGVNPEDSYYINEQDATVFSGDSEDLDALNLWLRTTDEKALWKVGLGIIDEGVNVEYLNDYEEENPFELVWIKILDGERKGQKMIISKEYLTQN
ncbi:hypothetical protein [Bacillus sp. MRMR6]|uniref:hypothetical protein n=1 Tax=Bacillus sp. MRMR6 TaxID=1928617 RepID=UPI0009523E0D|nr:hypothetical protein [Bacillus sp. MRMR6]OLS38586.1 hypothetical protein BTR25_14305 [Bacillus sp. MRMR6]